MSAYLKELEAAAAQLAGEAAALRASGREDEATLARIRINIHDICRTLYTVCARSAQEHEDGCRAAIEDIKLETLAANRQAYLERG